MPSFNIGDNLVWIFIPFMFDGPYSAPMSTLTSSVVQALAYNLADFLRTMATPARIERSCLASLSVCPIIAG